MPIYRSKFQNLKGEKKILKNWHLMAHQTANWWHIKKSETGHLEHPRIHLLTDSWWNKSMPGTLKAIVTVLKNATFFQ